MTQVSSRLDQLVARSLELIETTQAATGAWVAGPSFPTYHYSWFRDGAFIADAMSRHGRVGSADAFHGWAAGIVAARREQIARLVERGRAGEDVPATDHLHTRYTVDGREADGFWENFQLDGYGTWLWALRRHQERHHDGDLVHAVEVAATVDYLAAFWHEPSYDWWEEHLEHRHTSTLASIWSGMDAVGGWLAMPVEVREPAIRTAERIRHLLDTEAVRDGALTKWLGSDQVDGSLVACFTPFDLYPVDHPITRATVARVDAELAPAGVYRYLDDVYYGGGQWVLLAAFLGWHHARAGNRGRAEELLAWIVDQADPNGDLPEQVAQDMLHPEHLERWEQRWGPSAKPLLWSHAMLLDLVDELGRDIPSAPEAGR